MKKLRSFVRRFLDLYGFHRDALKFRDFLAGVPALPKPKVAGKSRQVAVVVSPWHYTPSPWYCISIAYLYRLRGFEPLVIWDDVPYADAARLGDQNRVIGRVLSAVARDLKVVRLSDYAEASLDAEDMAEVERLAGMYAIARFRSGIPLKAWDGFKAKRRRMLSANLEKVKTLIARDTFDHVVLQGGIYGNTSLFLWAARRNGLRVATHDAGFGLVLTGVDDVAAHQMDVAKSLGLEIAGADRAVAIAKQELERRMSGTEQGNGTESGSGPQSYQVARYEGTKARTGCDVLIPLNIDYDAAALGKLRNFEHSLDWLVRTIRHVLETADATVAVRQHPVERHAFYRARHDLKAELAARFPNEPRLRFFAAEEDVNTYDLIDAAKVVLPVTSTAGIEAAALGRCVVMESDAYYSFFPFVEKAETKEAYFSKITECLQRNTPLAPEKVRSALLCYFYAQVANRIYTDFTPQVPDFAKWVKRDFRSLVDDQVVQSMVTTLSEGVPAITWRTKEILSARSNAPS